MDQPEFDLTVPILPSTSPNTTHEIPPLVKACPSHNQGRFMVRQERHHSEYIWPHSDPGLVVIFNFESFTHSPDRDGTRIDVRTFIDTMGRIKFNIEASRIYNNLTTAELFNTIATLTNMTDINCVIVLILTHGNEDNSIDTYDGKTTIDEVITAFQKGNLNGIPQWFTVIACKKDNDEKPESTKLISEHVFTSRLNDHIIVFYSTLESHKSARHRDTGTWVMHELCKNILGYARRDDLFTILTRTNKCVANNYYTELENDGIFRQSPLILSTLQHKFFLTSSRERQAQIVTFDKVDSIHKLLFSKEKTTNE